MTTHLLGEFRCVRINGEPFVERADEYIEISPEFMIAAEVGGSFILLAGQVLTLRAINGDFRYKILGQQPYPPFNYAARRITTEE